jgi:O-antigen ligase
MRRLLAFLLAVAGAITLVGGTLRLPSVLASRLASITDPSQNPYDGRPDIYAEAFRLVNEAPVLGHGPGAFSVAAWEGLSTGRVLQAEHAHNLWLTIATEYGLLGLVSFLGLSMAVGWAGLSGTRALLRNGRPTDAAVCAGALAALVALLGHGLVDYPLRNPVLFLTYWAIAGLVLAFARFAATSVAGDPGSMSRRE